MIDESELSDDKHIIADEYSLGFATNRDTAETSFLIAFKGTRNMSDQKAVSSIIMTYDGALELAQNIANQLVERALGSKEDKTN